MRGYLRGQLDMPRSGQLDMPRSQQYTLRYTATLYYARKVRKIKH